MKKQIFAVIVAILGTGCAGLTVSGSAVPSGEPRQAISQQTISIYQAAPETAVVVGTVQAVATQNMNENLRVVVLLLEELTKQAAAIGGNGIVMKTISVDPVTGAETRTADAIYVPKLKSTSAGQ